MVFDGKTLAMVTGAVLLATALVLLMLYRANRTLPGLKHWAVSKVLACIYFVLVVGRGSIPDFLSIVVANGFLFAGWAVGLNGLRLYVGKQTRRVLPICASAAFVVPLAWLMDPADADLRVAIVSAGVALFALSNAVAVRGHTRQSPGLRLVSISCLLHTVVFLWRAVWAVTVPTGTDPLNAGMVTGIAWMGSILFAITVTCGLLMATAEMLARRLAGRTRELEREVAERRQVEARLRDSERQFRTMVEAAPFPIVVVNPESGRPFFVNRLAAELLGVRPDMGLHAGFGPFFVQPEMVEEILRRAMVAGPQINLELEAREPAGTAMWLLVSAVRLPFGDEDSILVSLNDITVRKRLELELTGARDRAEGALAVQNQAMTEQRNFLGMVSHEFRTPLGIINASAEMIAMDRSGQVEEDVDRIRRAVQRMARLIDTILADEWLDAASMSLSPQTLNLGKTLATICADRSGIDCRNAISFITASPSIHVRGDAMLLPLVFSNLLDNAIKYSPAGRPIDVQLSASEMGIVVSVRDYGIGISDEEKAKIFDKYYRSVTVGAKSGAGLGLYLVRKIVHLHQGRITVASPSGGGTLFTVCLPRIEAVPA